MRLTSFIFVSILLIFTQSCTKKNDPPPPPSSDKIINFFILKSANNNLFPEDIVGVISNDTIVVKVNPGVSLINLVPDIFFKGKMIAPLNKAPQNFTLPVHYVVTAEDGSSINYVVLTSFLSTTKTIESFTFKAADNNGLPADVTGSIKGDTIEVFTAAPVNFTNLIPTISFKGKEILPANKSLQNFSDAVTYTVTAEDRTTKVYTVIVSANATTYVGSSNGNLYAVDATTGILKWKFQTGNKSLSSPCIYNGIVYAGTSKSYLYAIDAATGVLKLKFMDFSGDYSYPSVHNGMVYFTVNDYYIGTYLYAIDTTGGEIRWATSSNGGIGTPTIINEILYCGNSSGVAALNALTGKYIWTVYGGLTFDNPAVVNNTIFTRSEGDIIKSINTITRTTNWEYRDDISSSNGPTVGDDAVFAGSINGLYAVNIKDGSLRWKFPDYPRPGSFSSPIVANGLVFSGAANNNTFYAINANTGKVAWSTNDICCIFR